MHKRGLLQRIWTRNHYITFPQRYFFPLGSVPCWRAGTLLTPIERFCTPRILRQWTCYFLLIIFMISGWTRKLTHDDSWDYFEWYATVCHRRYKFSVMETNLLVVTRPVFNWDSRSWHIRSPTFPEEKRFRDDWLLEIWGRTRNFIFFTFLGWTRKIEERGRVLLLTGRVNKFRGDQYQFCCTFFFPLVYNKWGWFHVWFI